MKSLKIFFAILVFTSITCYSKNYYVALTGNDASNGTSPTTAWQTLRNINQQVFKPGDSVLFKRGDVFSGEIVVKNSGAENKPIVFSAFGQGLMPVISGAITIKEWKKFTSHIYSAKVNAEVSQVYFDNNVQTMARYPNSGFLRIDEGFDDRINFADYDLLNESGYWEGANVRFRIWDWEYRTSVVTKYVSNKITIADSATNTFSAGWGYYFDNKFEELDTIGEWYYNKKAQTLYFIPPTTEIQKVKIETTTYTSAFTLEKNISYITIDKLAIEKYDIAGVLAKGNNQNITIKNNEFYNINLMAINFEPVSKSCNIVNNKIQFINGRAINALEAEYMRVERNEIKNIGNTPGYGISGVNGMIGISLTNIEKQKTEKDHKGTNNIIRRNTLENIGYAGIRMDGINSIMDSNCIKNAMMLLSDGGSIYCWAKSSFYTHDNIISNNFVQNSCGNNNSTPHPKDPIAQGIYIDNNVYNVKVINNTVMDVSGSGIHINSESHDIDVKENTIYNCSVGISIAEWGNKPNGTYGNSVEGNVLFLVSQDQRAVYITNWIIPSTKNLGTFNRNSYYSFYEKYFLKDGFLTGDHEMKIQQEYSFADWKKKYGFDMESKAYEYTHFLAQKFKRSSVFYTGNEPLTIDVSKKDYFNLDGDKISELTLRPFTSVILIYK